jgi:alkylation response protein AidB-like acyl-CoA dehydrogenase
VTTSTRINEDPTGESPAVDGATILANAHRIAPLLREHAAEVEAARRLTQPVVDALRGSGVFRMSMPRARGGPEVDLLSQLEILEVLSRADASAGWCAMIGSDSGFYSAFLDDAAGRELYPDFDSVTAGWILPAGRLEVSDGGGYRLSGRWSFGSGCTHADVISAGALVTEGGIPRLGADGRPDYRVALVPASQVQIHDTWFTTGLCGSGSNDYSIDAVAVPAEHTFGFLEGTRDETLYRWPGFIIANLIAVPLGVAADALDTAMGILTEKISMPDMVPAYTEARVQAAVASAQAMVGSARSYTYDTLGDLWTVIAAGDEPSFAVRAAVVGCAAHTITTCRDAVQLLVDTVGTAAVQRSCTLERNLRDLITIRQHLMGQVKFREWAGGLWFGQPTPLPTL